MEFLLDGIRAVTPQQCVMYVVGALLIYLAIKKDYELASAADGLRRDPREPADVRRSEPDGRGRGRESGHHPVAL